jgi:hypothetical protein
MSASVLFIVDQEVIASSVHDLRCPCFLKRTIRIDVNDGNIYVLIRSFLGKYPSPDLLLMHHDTLVVSCHAVSRDPKSVMTDHAQVLINFPLPPKPS